MEISNFRYIHSKHILDACLRLYICTWCHFQSLRPSTGASVTMMLLLFVSILLISFVPWTKSEYFPPVQNNITTRQSKFHSNVTIQYKETYVCETTPGVKSYSGYVHLPPSFLDGEAQDYPINTFFWFFESRKDPATAPLSIWLNGGPGASSIIGLLSENGPCFVGNDSNSTYINPWSWNNEVNILYIDQPTQVGYSYDILTNITVDLISGNTTGRDFSTEVPAQNNTFLIGTGPSQKTFNTANSTSAAAHAMWHFAQIWFNEFPFYKPQDEKISLWTESYGGHYGPEFVRVFEEKTRQIDNGSFNTPGAHRIHLDTLGIINGCMDLLIQSPFYLHMAYNNTYSIQGINQTVFEAGMYEWEKSGGVKDSILKCRRLIAETNTTSPDDDRMINRLCSEAAEQVETKIEGRYTRLSGRARFDITHPSQDPFPSMYFVGYLSQHWVQDALGVPVNSSWSSEAVYKAFSKTGDIARSGMLDDLGYVLDKGVKVALVHGDRDFACNWLGGEQVSLHINHSSAGEFRNAGYTPIQVNDSYVGGQVRQYGNLSFSRIYQAGHMVPSYQPETAYRVFMRAMFNKDIATGKTALSDDYNTDGPSSTWHIKNKVIPAPDPECYILNPGTCTEEQYDLVKNNTALVQDYIVIGRDGASEQAMSSHKLTQFPDNEQVFLRVPEP